MVSFFLRGGVTFGCPFPAYPLCRQLIHVEAAGSCGGHVDLFLSVPFPLRSLSDLASVSPHPYGAQLRIVGWGGVLTGSSWLCGGWSRLAAAVPVCGHLLKRGCSLLWHTTLVSYLVDVPIQSDGGCVVSGTVALMSQSNWSDEYRRIDVPTNRLDISHWVE